MRNAASGWEDDHVRKLTDEGFRQIGAASTIFFHTESHVPVVACVDDLTFAANHTELKRIRSKMSEWYGGKVRGTLGTGRRDVREIEIQRGNLRWTEQGLEKGASNAHRKAQMVGMGLNEESQMVKSAAVKLDWKRTRKCWRKRRRRGLEA